MELVFVFRVILLSGQIYQMGWFCKSLETVFRTTILGKKKKIIKYRLLAMITMATHQNLGQSLRKEKVPQLILTRDFKASLNRP